MKPGSKKWKKFMGKLYGLGAAVVILGALFKIQHWPGAGPMLIIGLGTEALIFIFSAFEPIHEEIDWSLVYPELATGERHEGEEFATEDQRSITEQLDDMLAGAKIEPELIESLGSGMRSLSEQAQGLSEITGAASATNDYVDTLKGATGKVSELSDAYATASESLVGLTSGAEAGKTAGESLQQMSTNLNSLNEMYELQLRSSREKLEAANEMYAGVTEMMENLKDSVEDTKRYKSNIAELSDNLSSLNTVYGNMLSAMNVNRG